MSVTIHGRDQLMSRIRAIRPSPDMMRTLGVAAIEEQKRLVPRKTGNLGRSIRLGSLTNTLVETVAGANYAAFVEFGTKAHSIVPVKAKALRFAVGGNRRLSGSPRRGAPVVFAKRVRHPGTKAQPFMLPGAVAAVESFGADAIVRRWNDAG